MNHISIEGMDGVGKSTTCKLLAKKLGYTFVEKPLHYLLDDPNEIVRYQEVAKRVNSNPNRNFTSMFYGLGSIYLYELFKEQDIVTDRHLASNYAWSGVDDNQDVYNLIIKKIGAPKLTVILYASKDVIVERLKVRDNEDEDLKRAFQSEEIYKKMIKFCDNNKFPFTLIDTSKLTPEEVVDFIIKELK